MTLNGYLSNATKNNISPRQAYNMLISEFRKGNINYPRTDGENHAPLVVLQPAYINPQVKKWIETEIKYDIQDLDDQNYLVKGDPFILNEFLKLSTPATIVNDYERACISKYEIETNKYVGIEHNLYEKELMDERVELNSFSFEEIILEAVSFELEIPENELEISIRNHF